MFQTTLNLRYVYKLEENSLKMKMQGIRLLQKHLHTNGTLRQPQVILYSSAGIDNKFRKFLFGNTEPPFEKW